MSKIKLFNSDGFAIRNNDGVSPKMAASFIKHGIARAFNDGYDSGLKLAKGIYTLYEAKKILKNRMGNIDDVPCWRCGKTTQQKPNKVPMCEKCRAIDERTKEIDMQQYRELSIKMMYRRAIKILERSKKEIYLYKYREACRSILDYALKHPEKFDSAHELLTAIILAQEGIRFEMHRKVFGYEVDVFLVDDRIFLEIDGYMHKYKEEDDAQRDLTVRKEYGDEFETIRIPTGLIERNPTALYEAIIKIKKEIKNTRSMNGGKLPVGWSNRIKKHREGV